MDDKSDCYLLQLDTKIEIHRSFTKFHYELHCRHHPQLLVLPKYPSQVCVRRHLHRANLSTSFLSFDITRQSDNDTPLPELDIKRVLFYTCQRRIESFVSDRSTLNVRPRILPANFSLSRSARVDVRLLSLFRSNTTTSDLEGLADHAVEPDSCDVGLSSAMGYEVAQCCNVNSQLCRL